MLFVLGHSDPHSHPLPCDLNHGSISSGFNLIFYFYRRTRKEVHLQKQILLCDAALFLRKPILGPVLPWTSPLPHLETTSLIEMEQKEVSEGNLVSEPYLAHIRQTPETQTIWDKALR